MIYLFSFFLSLLDRKLLSERKAIGHEPPPFIYDFLTCFDEIRMEWLSYVSQLGARGVPIDQLSDEQRGISTEGRWKAVFLYGYGFFNRSVEPYFPKSIEVLKRNRKKINLMMFSTTESNAHIPPHEGSNLGVLRIQIGIDVIDPESCVLTVNGYSFILREKEFLIFDDTFTHEVFNQSRFHRTVLIIDYYKKLPYFYSLLFWFKNRSMAKSNYVQQVLKRL